MKAECIKRFLDISADTMREVGEQFEVTAERFNEINSTRYGQLVKKVQAPRKPKAKKEE